jgi:hypothetical protein
MEDLPVSMAQKENTWPKFTLALPLALPVPRTTMKISEMHHRSTGIRGTEGTFVVLHGHEVPRTDLEYCEVRYIFWQTGLHGREVSFTLCIPLSGHRNDDGRRHRRFARYELRHPVFER